jgi:hypothetical protein
MQRRFRALVALCLCLLAASALAQSGTAFTWQGRLSDGGAPANGSFEMEFRLFAGATGGSPLATFVPPTPVAVSSGNFAVPVDFGAAFAGQDAWIEMALRPSGGAQALVAVSPRRRVTPAPGALFAQFAAATGANSVSGGSIIDSTVTSADVADGSLRAADLDTSSASQGVQRRVAGACAANQAIRSIATDGSVACEVDDSGWALGGNAGTNPGSDFIGTTDAQPFVLRSPVGIGVNTDAPTRALDVAGAIRARSGGVEFPEGGLQPAAADPPEGVWATSGLDSGGSHSVNCSGLAASGARLAEALVITRAPGGQAQAGPLVLERAPQAGSTWRGVFENGTAVASCTIAFAFGAPGVVFTIANPAVEWWGYFTGDDGRPIERIALRPPNATSITRASSVTTVAGQPSLASYRGFTSGAPAAAAYRVSWGGVVLPQARVVGDFRRARALASGVPSGVPTTTDRLQIRINPTHQPNPSLAASFFGEIRSALAPRALVIDLPNASGGTVPIASTPSAAVLRWSLRIGADGRPIEEVELEME